MMKRIYFLSACFLLLLLVSSCKSKKHIPVTHVIRPELLTETLDSLQKRSAVLSFREDDFWKDKNWMRKDPTKKSKGGYLNGKRSQKPHRVMRYVTRTTLKLGSMYGGIDRVVNYEFAHSDLPKAFDGCRLAFISDLHYKSLFQERNLKNLVKLLKKQEVDVLLMGGDYQEGCEYVEPLFHALSAVKTPLGTHAVLGNNDYERCHDEIVRTMKRYGMSVLEHKVDTLRRGDAQILIAGVRNPFDLAKNGVSPTLALSPKDFVILLVHTPDYVEDVSVANTDLALAGHTHGGQVRVLGKAPIVPSRYGDRFLTGLMETTARVPVIVTNGIGTSQLPIRIGAPAEIVIITLRYYHPKM